MQKRLGDTVRQRRNALGISQERLALESDVDRTYVSQLERGIANPSLRTLFRLSAVLDVDLKSLL